MVSDTLIMTCSLGQVQIRLLAVKSQVLGMLVFLHSILDYLLQILRIQKLTLSLHLVVSVYNDWVIHAPSIGTIKPIKRSTSPNIIVIVVICLHPLSLHLIRPLCSQDILTAHVLLLGIHALTLRQIAVVMHLLLLDVGVAVQKIDLVVKGGQAVWVRVRGCRLLELVVGGWWGVPPSFELSGFVVIVGTLEHIRVVVGRRR